MALENVDASIPLQAGRNLPTFGPDYNALLTMQRIQQAQQVTQAQNALKQLYSDQSNYDPKTMQPTPEAWANLARVSPPAMMDLRNNLLKLQGRADANSFNKSKVFDQFQKDGEDVGAKVWAGYQDALTKMPPEAARKWAQENIYTPLVTDWKKTLSPEMAAMVPNDFIPQRTAAMMMNRDIYKAQQLNAPKEHRAEEKLQLEQSKDLRESQKAQEPRFYGDVTNADGKAERVPLLLGGETGYLDFATKKPVQPKNVSNKGPDVNRQEYGKVSQIAIDDPSSPGDTKIVPAQQNAKTGQWVTADANRDPLPTPKRIVSTGGSGRQAEAQTMAMVNAGNEASASLKNLVELPIGATSGWFKGLTSVPADSLAANIGRSVAGYVNDRDARSLQISWQGIGRSMATLEAAGRATGLVGLQKQAEALQPQKNDSYTTVLRSYAEIRQIIDRSVETIKTSPGVSADQKKLLDKIVKEAEQTVPWTVHDVNMLETGGKDSVVEFAKKVKAGAAGRTEAETAIPPAPGAPPQAGQGASVPVPPAPGAAGQLVEPPGLVPPMAMVPEKDRHEGAVVGFADGNGVNHTFVVKGGKLVPWGN